MTKIVHDSAIDWPNGLGYTPCSAAYAETMDERDALKPEWVRLDDLSSEDYNTFCTLDSKLNLMQHEGHLGKSVRY